MRNLKKLLAVVLVVAVMLTAMSAVAFADTATISADAQTCATVGMLQGSGSGVTAAYTASQPTRAQAALLFLRLKGLDADALAFTGTENFPDVTNTYWKPITAYLKAHPELGFGGTYGKFNPNDKMDAKSYYKVMLVALGYTYGTDFTWDNVVSFAASKGLSKALDAKSFTVDTLATATVETLKATVKGTDTTLVEALALANADFAAKAVTAGLYKAAAPLTVKSVTILNADQIQVVFNTKVNSTSATSMGNYSIIGTAGTTSAVAGTASLQSDNKTVVITLSTALANGAVFGFKVSGVIDTVGATIADYTVTLTANDKTAPTLVSATSSAKVSTSTITLTFSEPVNFSGIASVTVDGSFAPLTPGSDKCTVTATTATSMLAGSTHTLSLMNFKDYADNYTATNPLPTSLTVTADTTAPNVVSVVAKSDKTVEVTFDKGMNIATFNGAYLNTRVRILDSQLGATAGSFSAVSATDGTNKVFDFTLTGTSWPSSNTISAIVAFTSDIADSAGNTLAGCTKNVTLTKDTAAPALVSAVYKNVGSYGTTSLGTAITTTFGCMVFKYNEEINAGVTPTTVITDQGASITTPFNTPTVNNADKTELVVPLNATVASSASTYMVLMPSGMVTDNAQSANSSVAGNQIVNVSAGGVVTGDTTAPALNGSVSTNYTSQNLTSGAVIYVNYTESNMDLSTVVSISNYMLDGKPLPSGSYVTVTSTSSTAVNTTVTIPSGNLASDKTGSSGYVLSIAGIKDKSGNTMPVQVAVIPLYADVQPVLNSAVLNADGTVSAGFSSDVVAAGTVTDGSNLVVTINGTAKTFATAAAANVYTLTAGTGADAGKYVITVYDASGVKLNLNNATGISVATAGTTTAGAGKVVSNAHLGAAVKGGTSITVR